jgi:hypothetical protein
MRASALLLLLPSFAVITAQTEWTPAVPVTAGDFDDTHPVLVSRHLPMVPFNNEWVAFSRQNSGEPWKNIFVLSSGPAALSWPGPAVPITRDSAVHDFPSLAGVPIGGLIGPEHLMLAWESDDHGTSHILWSHRRDSLWSVPQPVQPDGGEHTPCVTPAETTFFMVWERRGVVLYSEFRDTLWIPAVQVSAPGDSMCTHPAVFGLGDLPQTSRAIAVWESEKPLSMEHALWFSLLNGSSWTAPDTLAWDGDNRNPRFFKEGAGGRFNISWESNRTGDWEILASGGFVFGGTLTWDGREMTVSNNPLADDRHAALQIAPIITRGTDRLIFSTASAWTTASVGSDSIAVRALGDWQTSYRTAAPGSIDRNPDISSGLFLGGWVRVWTLWENNNTGRWNLYGTSVDFSVGVKEDGPGLPEGVELAQNYPNPFNGETTIRYRTKDSGYGVRRTGDAGRGQDVLLDVYDVLGRRVATLVDGPVAPGIHTVRIDASGLPSGVYIYRLTSGNLTVTRSMIVLR